MRDEKFPGGLTTCSEIQVINAETRRIRRNKEPIYEHGKRDPLDADRRVKGTVRF